MNNKKIDKDCTTLPAITFQKLFLSYQNEFQFFKDLSFEIPFPSFCLLLGQTGSGKTSILSLIKGIIPYIKPQSVSGDILIFGKKLNYKNFFNICKNIGLLTQDPEVMTLESSLEYEIAFTLESLNYRKYEIKAKITQMRKSYPFINFLFNNDPKTLSAGEITLLQIILGLLPNPEIMLYDEPLSSLDFKQKMFFVNLIKNLKRSKTIVVATHDFELFLPIVDYFLILDKSNNKIAFYGSKSEFFTTKMQFPWLNIPILLDNEL